MAEPNHNGGANVHPTFMNILTPILRHAARKPGAPALVHGKALLTYSQLQSEVAKAAYGMQQGGVRPGDRIALVGVSSPQYVVLALACAWLGCAVFLLPKEEADAADRVVRVAGGTVAICAGDSVAPPALADRALKLADLMRPIPEGEAAPEPAQDVTDDLWCIFFSSGTTGNRKAIGWTHASMGLFVVQFQSYYPATPAERLHLAISVGLMFGTCVLMKTLHGGGSAILAATDPGQWLEEMRRFSPTVAAMTSYQAIQVGEALGRAPPDGPRVTPESLKVVICGGGPLPGVLHARLKERFAPHVFNHYGSSEAGFNGRSPGPDMPPMLTPWCDIQAVDEDDRPLPPGKVGRLRVRDPVMTQGYIGDDEANAKYFKGGWFYPGDVGSVSASGLLTLAGRVDERLNMGGSKVNPEAIEAILAAHPSVQECAAFLGQVPGGPETIIALLVLRDGAKTEGLVPALKAACAKELGPGKSPRAFFAVQAFPRTISGKVIRHRLAELVSDAAALA